MRFLFSAHCVGGWCRGRSGAGRRHWGRSGWRSGRDHWLATMGLPSGPRLSRVNCIAWFTDGRVVDPVVLDGQTFPVSLHTSRNYGCVPFRPCEGHQGIFVAPSADHGVSIWCPSSWHSDLTRKIAGGAPHSIDGQRPKPGLKCGTGGWINLDAKDAKNHGW